MKILNIVIAKNWGGGEQYVYDTAKALQEKKVKVFIAVDGSNKALIERFKEVANVVTVNLYRWAGFGAYAALKKFIKENSIDIINCHSGHAMILCIFLKKATQARLCFFKHNAIKAKMDVYHRWQRTQIDGIVCVSQLVFNLQTSRLSEIERKKFYLVYNGIDIDKFKNIVKKHSDKRFVIGFAGRIAKDKGLDTLIEAYSRLVETDCYRLVLAGSDEKGYMAELKKLIKERNLDGKVTFLGQVKDMRSFYSSIDVLALPSKVREAFGLVICEAMYCGVPVITTNSGAQEELICDSKYGSVINVGDSDALAGEIAKLQKEQSKYREIAAAGRKRVEDCFTSEICATNLMKVFQNCLN